MAPVTLAYTTAVALLIGSLARTSVATYFYTLIAWLAGPLFTLVTVRATVWIPAPLGEFYASGRIVPQGATGFFYNADLVLFNRLFILGLALAALGSLLVLGARRRRRPVLPHAVALLLALLLAAGAAVAVQQDWAGRNAAIAHELDVMPYPEQATETLAFPVTTDDYHLGVTLDPSSASLRAEGTFTVTNISGGRLSSIPLTLRRDFAVSGVTVDGEPVAFQREGDHLHLPVPLDTGESAQVSATWEGRVWQWRVRDVPRLAAHVADESVLLPAHYGWYPIPGAQTFTRTIPHCAELIPNCPRTLDDQPVGHPPATFHVRADGTDLYVRHDWSAPRPTTGSRPSARHRRSQACSPTSTPWCPAGDRVR